VFRARRRVDVVVNEWDELVRLVVRLARLRVPASVTPA
jgi:hypothetical protein